jgi:tight adherence protein C
VTSAVLLALLAGATAAGAVVELAALAGRRAGRGPAPGRRAVLALVALGRRAGLPLRPPADLVVRLAAAGVGDGGAATAGAHGASGAARPPGASGRADPLAEVMALKTGAALVAGLLALPLAGAAPGRLWLVVVPGLPAAAYLAPDVWLARRARRRAQVLAVQAPEVLDLVRIAVAAGLPVMRAFGEVGRRHGGLLAAELGTASARTALGEPTARALDRLRARCPAPAVHAMVAAVDRSARHGAPLAPALAAIATDARAERARRIQDRAARAAPKIQLVVALLLVPAVLLLVAAALVVSML